MMSNYKKWAIFLLFFLAIWDLAKGSSANPDQIKFQKKFIPEKRENGKVILSNFIMDANDLAYISKLKGVVEIELTNCKYKPTEAEVDFGTIEKIRCYYSDFEFLKTPRNLGNLKHLEMIAKKITKSEIDFISNLKCLESLSISVRIFPNEDATESKGKYSALRNLMNLKTLKVSDLGFSDSDLSSLKKIPSLQDLEIQYSSLTSAAFACFKELKSLEKLSIYFPNLQDDHLLELSQNRNLNDLRFFDYRSPAENPGKPITKEGIKHLSTMKGLRCLYFPSSDFKFSDLKCFENLTNLEELSLVCESAPSGKTDQGGLEFVLHLPKLGFLEFNSVNLNQQDIRILGKCKNLKRATFIEVQLGEKCEDALLDLRNLTKIKIYGGNFSVPHLTSLGRNSNLKELALEFVGIRSSDLKVLEKTQLEKIKLSLNGNVDQEGFRSLSSIESLQVIDIDCLDFPGSEISRLGRMPKLKEIILELPHKESLDLSPLSKSTSLEKIYIGGNFRGGELVRNFQAPKSLINLMVNSNDMNEEDFKRFVENNPNCLLDYYSRFGMLGP